LATIWSFFQPQLKRHGDVAQEAAELLRSQVSFRLEWQSKLQPGTVFFQTMPRNKDFPIIPLALDNSELNGWDRVANNAYYLYVVLLSLVFGKIGRGLPLNSEVVADKAERDAEDRMASICLLAADGGKQSLPEFIEDVQLQKDHKRDPERAATGGPIPLEDGLVVDHIFLSTDASVCWKRNRMVRTILGWTKLMGREGVYESRRVPGSMKGIMSFPNFACEGLTVSHLKMLASVAPGCTVNCIKESQVIRKFRLHVPLRIVNLPSICCKNTLCVSNPANKQRDISAFFERVPFYETSALPTAKTGEHEYLYVCKYCKWPHQYEDIWTTESMRYYASLERMSDGH